MAKTIIGFFISLIIVTLWYLHYIRVIKPENKAKKYMQNKILKRFEKTIDDELKKGDEANFDLIDELTAKVIELKGYNAKHNTEEIKQKIMKGEIL